MLSFLSSFLTFVVSAAEAHPEVAKQLATDVYDEVKKWLGHPNPASTEASAALNAGIAAAAASAATSIAAKETSAAVPVPAPSTPTTVDNEPEILTSTIIPVAPKAPITGTM